MTPGIIVMVKKRCWSGLIKVSSDLRHNTFIGINQSCFTWIIEK